MAIILVSCGGSQGDEPVTPVTPPVVQDQQREMAFGATMPDNQSESRDSRSPLEETYKHFKIFAYKHTTTGSQTVMPGYSVKYDDASSDTKKWKYDPTAYSDPNDTDLKGQFLKYWDRSADRYTFNGYAPINDANAAKITCDAVNGLQLNDFQAHIPMSDDNDLVVCGMERTYSSSFADNDLLVANPALTAPTLFYDNMPLRFHHPLANVEFRIYNSGDDVAFLYEARIKLSQDNMDHFFISGDFAVKPTKLSVGSANKHWYCTYENWSADGVLLEDKPATAYELNHAEKTEPEKMVVHSTLEVPQSMDGKEILITLNVNGIPLTKTFTMTDVWEWDMKYIYYISFKTSNDNPILVDVEVESFTRGGIVDNTQTNW